MGESELGVRVAAERTANLSPQTVLRRAPELSLHVDSSDQVTITVEGGTIGCGPHGLAVLDVFSRPISFADALARLESHVKGAQDWMDLTSTVLNLYRAGVLQDESGTRPTFRTGPVGFDAPGIHVKMLNDRARTESFIAGINEVVRTGDVVVDIGTGTGILAMAASRAGARHVYAVEASGIAKSARAVFAQNGLAERITLIEGWSTRVTLPERADVVVSEIIGSDPLGERVLEAISDAVKRFLKPGGRSIPSRIGIFLVPVSVPSSVLTKETFTAETVANWKSWYGFDFRPLNDIVAGSPHLCALKPELARDWDMLADPLPVADIDLCDLRELRIEKEIRVSVDRPGRLDGVIVFFELELGPATLFSMHPKNADKDWSWRYPLWLLAKPLDLRPGDSFTLSYSYRTGSRDRVGISLVPQLRGGQ